MAGLKDRLVSGAHFPTGHVARRRRWGRTSGDWAQMVLGTRACIHKRGGEEGSFSSILDGNGVFFFAFVVRREGGLSPSTSGVCGEGAKGDELLFFFSASGRRGQAPKGTGGMPRRHQQDRAWKAAKCPGELPNERRSRDTRHDPGN